MNLAGKTVVLTGATTGMGRATALALAGQPARLVIHGPQAAREVSGPTHSLQAAMQPGAELTYLRSDYGDLASVARLARDIRSSAGGGAGTRSMPFSFSSGCPCWLEWLSALT